MFRGCILYNKNLFTKYGAYPANVLQTPYSGQIVKMQMKKQCLWERLMWL